MVSVNVNVNVNYRHTMRLAHHEVIVFHMSKTLSVTNKRNHIWLSRAASKTGRRKLNTHRYDGIFKTIALLLITDYFHSIAVHDIVLCCIVLYCCTLGRSKITILTRRIVFASSAPVLRGLWHGRAYMIFLCHDPGRHRQRRQRRQRGSRGRGEPAMVNGHPWSNRICSTAPGSSKRKNARFLRNGAH